MTKVLAVSLALFVSTASVATPLETAVSVAERLGAPIPLEAAPRPATPASSTAPPRSAAAVAPISGSVSGYADVSGNGMLNCSGGPGRSGSMSGWINLRADVSVTTSDGASGTVPVTGTVFLSGSCQNGGGFVSGNAMLNGSGSLYNAGRFVGTASLSGSAFINQYVNGGFAWINQNVYLSGRFDTTGAQ